ncbi:LysR family transcriptional regulator [Psychromicrobium lacuslunae]|uniref:HTH lysR-type domain-containing protein n=1 Tax=Psychromicrobium lacuslunae TaxID=1618207 RepID=A0A0D4BZC9_9MICC|nr:LysR family transcriptional regulator [Psychromicrobium lacuslunae]AJT41797.1 hypothetical protein UM93_10190 [Psychromicrobium lacuslunae]
MVDVLGLRVLIAIADTGSVTGAARELGYAPSNITQHLRRLEAALRTPMVERLGRGIILTDRARALVERGRSVLLELEDLASATTPEPSGTVDVAAFPTGLRGLLIPVIAELAGSVPSLRLKPQELEPAEALDRLRAGRVHAAIVKEWGKASTHRDELIRQQLLGIDPIDVVLPAAHPLARARSLALAELTGQAWVLTPDDDPGYRGWFASYQKVLGLKPSNIYEASEFASMISFVEHDLAITLLPRLGRPALPPGVVAVPLSGRDAHRTVLVAIRRSSQSSPNVTALLAALRNQAGRTLSRQAQAAGGPRLETASLVRRVAPGRAE